MKAKVNRSKGALRVEMFTLRKKIDDYFSMDGIALSEEFCKVFPAQSNKTTRELKIRQLVMAATYYFSNALDLD